MNPTCPYCQQSFETTDPLFNGNVECPHCHKSVELIRGKSVADFVDEADRETSWFKNPKTPAEKVGQVAGESVALIVFGVGIAFIAAILLAAFSGK